MLSQDSGESSGSTVVDGEIIPSTSSRQSQVQSMAMKCADSLPNLSSNVVGRGLISPSLDVPAEAQAGTLPSPQASTSSADMRKGSECYTNSSLATQGSPRYSGNYYRGGVGHAYNGTNDLASKRSNRSALNQLSGNVNRHHVGGSFSPQTVSGSSGFGYTHHGNRSHRDSGSGDGRVVSRRMGRSATTDDVHGGPNHAVVDGKFVRILQRPLPLSARPLGEDVSADDGENDKSSPEALQQQQQQLKRAGHRKKTLSLNPEEREALENLVEEVIIGGLGEAIIDSDETSSDDNDDDNTELSGRAPSESNRENNAEHLRRTDVGRHRDKVFEFNRDNRIMDSKAGVKDNAGSSERNYSPKNDGKSLSRNNGRDFNRRGRDSSNTNSNARGKEIKRGEFTRQNKDGSPEEEKEKPNAATVRGVNIYPAQLKVAIKHMDSLPPRFLRRLQTGSNRTSGNESIIARLTMKSPTAVPGIADDASSMSSPTDRDRGKSKQTQLQETKKTIRNLLCDLDQYTDETVNTKEDVNQHINASADSQETNLVFSTAQDVGYTGPVNSPPSTTQLVRPQQPFYVGQQPHSLDQQFVSSAGMLGIRPPLGAPIFEQSLPMFRGQSQAPQMISCEDLERELLLGSSKTPTSNSHAVADTPANKVGTVPLPASNQFYQHALPQADGAFLNYEMQQQQLSGSSAVQSSPVTPKKSQFSVDAPEFVSSFYVMNRQANQTDMGIQNNEPFYSANNAEMSVQLTDNVHLPSKQPIRPYPMAMVSSTGLAMPSSAVAPEYVEMSTGNNGVTSSPYQMVSYEQMNSPNMAMMRNTPSYMVPMAPSSVTCSSEVVSPSIIDMNVMQYPPYQFVSGNSGYGTNYPPPVPDFQSSTSEFSQPPPSFMTAPICANDGMSQQWLSEPSGPQQPWYSGYTNMTYENSATYGSPPQSCFDEVAYGSSPVMSGYQPQQLINTGVNVDTWSYGNLTPFEFSRQKVLQLLSKGANVVVIWIGSEGNKSSLISHFPSNGTGPVMLNIRNGTNSSNVHEWNVKQVINALENRRNPVIIDLTFAQSWEMDRYTKLAEVHGYHVEVIDSTGNSMRDSDDSSQKSIIGGDMYHGSQVINSESYQGQSFGNSGDIYNQGQKDMSSVESLIPNI